MSKKVIVISFFISITLIIFGICKVNINSSQGTRNNSNFQVCVNESQEKNIENTEKPKLIINKNPFKIKVDIKNYIVFIDKSVVQNIKSKGNNLIKGIREDIDKLYSIIKN